MESGEPPPPHGSSESAWGDGHDCDCGPPPPEFLLPPPPRPPFLQNEFFCSEDPLPDIETCDAIPMIESSYRSSQSFPYIIIAVGSMIFIIVFLVFIVLFCKHRRKVQNFLPCKTSPANHCGGSGGPGGPVGDPNNAGGGGGIYEDLNDVRPTARAIHHAHHPHYHHTHTHHLPPSIEMIDVKNQHFPSGYPMTPHSPPVFLCPSPGPDPYSSRQDLYNPVYEELSDADSDAAVAAPLSEDEFAEDELSLTGIELQDDQRGGEMRLMAELHCPPPPYSRTPCNIRRDGRTLPYRRQQQPLPPVPTGPNGNSSFRRPRSLDRRRNPPSNDWIRYHPEPGEFHEGLVLNMVQHYRVGLRNGSNGIQENGGHRLPFLISSNAPPITDTGRISPHQTTAPYDSVPVIGHYGGTTTFRPPPKPHSQDSALGSDSGYSNHTAGTRTSNGSGSNRGGNGNGGSGRRSGGDMRRLSQLSADLQLT